MIKPESNNLESKILEAVVAPDEATFSPGVAKAVLALGFQSTQQAEIDRLLSRSNAGTITPKQKTRLEAYVRVGNFLSLLKAKARTTLSTKAQRR